MTASTASPVVHLTSIRGVTILQIHDFVQFSFYIYFPALTAMLLDIHALTSVMYIFYEVHLNAPWRPSEWVKLHVLMLHLIVLVENDSHLTIYALANDKNPEMSKW